MFIFLLYQSYKISFYINLKSLNQEFKDYLQIKLNPSNLCKVSGQFVFIYVLSSIENIQKRQLIRQTWANNIDIRVGFIIGQTNESVYKKIIEKEYNQYGDLIQGNFIDSYRFFLIESEARIDTTIRLA